MAKNKNRKSFAARIHINHKKSGPKASATIYRIKHNKFFIIGYIDSVSLDTAGNRNFDIVSFLKYNGHVLAGHTTGNEFLLTVV